MAAKLQLDTRSDAVHKYLIDNRMEHLKLQDQVRDRLDRIAELNDIHAHVEHWRERQCTRRECELHAQFR